MDGNHTEPTSLDILAKENPLSLYNMVSPSFKAALDKVPDDTWSLVQENMYIPHSSSDVRVKLRLWELYAQAKLTKESIHITEIADGICHRTTITNIIGDPKRLAWLFIPPKDYLGSIDAAQEIWLSRMFEILSLPIRKINPDGSPGPIDMKAANLVLKAGIAVDLRKHGSPIMRTEQKNLNVNVDGNKKDVIDITEIDKKLEELEAAVAAGALPAPPKDLPSILDAEFEDITGD